MTRLDLQIKIKAIREELENRYKHGTVKMSADGNPIPTEKLQKEIFSLIYKMSKLDKIDS